MEQFGAQLQMSIDVCLREIRKAEVVILLIGPRYGSLLPQGISEVPTARPARPPPLPPFPDST